MLQLKEAMDQRIGAIVVGPSGCGKSTLASALITLLARNARVTSGGVLFGGHDILSVSEEEKRKLRGRHIAMIFQDPMTSFNPVLTIGEQLVDFQDQREGLSKSEKRQRAAAMLKRVGISDPGRCLDRYVHELSGGMRQRAAIAAALLMAPSDARDRLAEGVFLTPCENNPAGRINASLAKVILAEPVERKFLKALKNSDIEALTFPEQLNEGVREGWITAEEKAQLEELRALTWEAITVDDFDSADLEAASLHRAPPAHRAAAA